LRGYRLLGDVSHTAKKDDDQSGDKADYYRWQRSVLHPAILTRRKFHREGAKNVETIMRGNSFRVDQNARTFR